MLCITSDRSRWLQPVFEVVDAERSKAFILQVNMRCLHLYGDGLTETSMFLQVLHEAIKVRVSTCLACGIQRQVCSIFCATMRQL